MVRIGKICRKVISKDSVIKVPVWNHEECLKGNHLDKLKQISEFVGFGELSKEDQVRLFAHDEIENNSIED